EERSPRCESWIRARPLGTRQERNKKIGEERRGFVSGFGSAATNFFKRIVSPLKYQTRCVTAFPDQQGFFVRVGVHHLDDSQQNKNFAFKCHRDGNEIYSINALNFHPSSTAPLASTCCCHLAASFSSFPTAHPQRSGIGSTIADGMTWGAGNAIGHRVVDAVMGPRTIKHETVVSEAAAPASAPHVANSMGSASAAPPVANMAFASCNSQSKAFQENSSLRNFH
ncbi:hypothetical protein HID58_089804, partial [Brassica napus]